jgi:hypothetical protein
MKLPTATEGGAALFIHIFCYWSETFVERFKTTPTVQRHLLTSYFLKT